MVRLNKHKTISQEVFVFLKDGLGLVFDIPHVNALLTICSQFNRKQGRPRRYGRYCHGRATFWADNIFLNYTFWVFISTIFFIFSVFIFFLLSNRNKIEKLLYLDFQNQTDNPDLKQVATELCASSAF